MPVITGHGEVMIHEASGTGVGEEYIVGSRPRPGSDATMWQAVPIGTVSTLTVDLEARLGEDAPWESFGQITDASGKINVVIDKAATRYRANISVFTGTGSVKVYLVPAQV